MTDTCPSVIRIGRYETPVLTFDQCLDLIDRLDTPYAQEFKKKCRDVLKRYFAGDESLVNEIRANAQSDNPLAQGCRNELASEGRLHNQISDIDRDADVFSVKKMVNVYGLLNSTGSPELWNTVEDVFKKYAVATVEKLYKPAATNEVAMEVDGGGGAAATTITVAQWIQENRPGFESWATQVGIRASALHRANYPYLITERGPEDGLVTNRYPVAYAHIIESAFEAVRREKQQQQASSQQRVDHMFSRA